MRIYELIFYLFDGDVFLFEILALKIVHIKNNMEIRLGNNPQVQFCGSLSDTNAGYTVSMATFKNEVKGRSCYVIRGYFVSLINKYYKTGFPGSIAQALGDLS